MVEKINLLMPRETTSRRSGLVCLVVWLNKICVTCPARCLGDKVDRGSGKITNNRPRASASKSLLKQTKSVTQESTRPTLVDDKHLLGPFFYYISSLPAVIMVRDPSNPLPFAYFRLPFVGSISMFVLSNYTYIYLTVTTASTKSTDYGANERVFFGLVSMPGWRWRRFCSYPNVPF